MIKHRATPIDPDHPLWREAIDRARESIGMLWALHAEAGPEAMVKYAFITSSGEKEHVWGELLELSEDSMRVTMETPPIHHRGELPRELNVPISDLEDWQLSLPDGRIRGGFTTQAQIKIARESGSPIPRHV